MPNYTFHINSEGEIGLDWSYFILSYPRLPRPSLNYRIGARKIDEHYLIEEFRGRALVEQVSIKDFVEVIETDTMMKERVFEQIEFLKEELNPKFEVKDFTPKHKSR